jgi:hypothetical protein
MADTHSATDLFIVPADALLKLLDILAGQNSQRRKFNLRMAGGTNIEHGGEFVFAVDDDETDACTELLTDERYEFDVVTPHHCHASDEAGALAACIRKEIGEGDRKIHEIFIGTPEPNGEIPIQFTTMKTLAGDEAHAAGHEHGHPPAA